MNNGPQTIPEFMIAKWMKDNGLQPGKFGLQVKGNKGVISDNYGATIDVRYDPETKTVFFGYLMPRRCWNHHPEQVTN